VIGTDGLHSNVRTLAFGPESEFAKPFGKYVGIWTMPNLFDLDRQYLSSYLPGKRVAVLQYGREKHTRGMALFSSPRLTFDRQDPDAAKAIINQVLRDHDEHWGVRELLQTLGAASDLYFDDITQIHMPTWSKGRVALVGDAGYAPTLMSGQGTSVALVGGYVLASELARAGGDHTVAFPAYEAAMRRYVELNQAIPDQAEEFTVPDTWEEIRRKNEAVKEMLLAVEGIPVTERENDRTTATVVTQAANAIELSLVQTAAAAPSTSVSPLRGHTSPPAGSMSPTIP
jgi:2-polyprenyl-6-methoxyphenol hydroxylase-like FAD-dependent oxidoreductase